MSYVSSSEKKKGLKTKTVTAKYHELSSTERISIYMYYNYDFMIYYAFGVGPKIIVMNKLLYDYIPRSVEKKGKETS